jgi:hypothetical protein
MSSKCPKFNSQNRYNRSDIGKICTDDEEILYRVSVGNSLNTRYAVAFNFLIVGNRHKYIEKWQIIKVKYRFVELVSS